MLKNQENMKDKERKFVYNGTRKNVDKRDDI